MALDRGIHARPSAASGKKRGFCPKLRHLRRRGASCAYSSASVSKPELLRQERIGERPVLGLLRVSRSRAVTAFGGLVVEHIVSLRLHLGGHHAPKHGRDTVVRRLRDEEDRRVRYIALDVLERRVGADIRGHSGIGGIAVLADPRRSGAIV